MSNVADSKVQTVTGHRSNRMTEHYTHFDTRQFTEVRAVQAELLTYDKPKKAGGKKSEAAKTAATAKKAARKKASV